MARLRLEPLSLAHLPGYHAIWSNEHCTSWSARPDVPLKTIEQSRARLEGQVASIDENPQLYVSYAIILLPLAVDPLKDNPENEAVLAEPTEVPIAAEADLKPAAEGEVQNMIGVISLHSYPPAELGYMFLPPYWGKGYATEALHLFLQLYFNGTKIPDRIIAHVNPDNPASINVLCKTGFTQMEVVEKDVVMTDIGAQKKDAMTFEYLGPVSESVMVRRFGAAMVEEAKKNGTLEELRRKRDQLDELKWKREELEIKLRGIDEAEAVIKKHFEEAKAGSVNGKSSA